MSVFLVNIRMEERLMTPAELEFRSQENLDVKCLQILRAMLHNEIILVDPAEPLPISLTTRKWAARSLPVFLIAWAPPCLTQSNNLSWFLYVLIITAGERGWGWGLGLGVVLILNRIRCYWMVFYQMTHHGWTELRQERPMKQVAMEVKYMFSQEKWSQIS